MNLPNAITIGRIALVPLFIVLAYGNSKETAVAAFITFGVASGSDFVDGYIARRKNVVSPLGEFLDPLADKLLIGAALFVLVATRDFPLWAAVVIAVREAVVQVWRTRIVRQGGRLPASQAAKLKTMLQIFMVAWWLYPWNDINLGHWAWLGAVLATTLWSGAEYFIRYKRVEEVLS